MTSKQKSGPPVQEVEAGGVGRPQKEPKNNRKSKEEKTNPLGRFCLFVCFPFFRVVVEDFDG